MCSIYRGLNKVKVPALVTLIVGVVNISLAIVLVRFTSLGIYGVAVSLLICLTGKNLLFVPVYVAVITKQPKTAFIKELFLPMIMWALVAFAALGLSSLYDLATIPRLAACSIGLAIIYALVCYTLIINKDEKVLLRSLIFRQS